MQRLLPRLFLYCLLMMTCAATSLAQETAATLSGVVLDAKGAAVSGASVIVKHEPTGFSTGVETNSKGIFTLPNLKPGGPYTVTISYTGYKTITLDNVNLSLGANPSGDITLQQNGAQLTEVVVTGSGRRSVPGTSVGRAQLTTLPTLGRSLSD